MQFGTVVVKNLMRRKPRSFLTVAGIGVAIGSLVALVSISDGFVAMLEESAAKRRTDLIVVQESKAASTIFSLVDESLKSTLEDMPGIKKARAILVEMVTIEDRPWTQVIGTVPGEYDDGDIVHFELVDANLDIIEEAGLDIDQEDLSNLDISQLSSKDRYRLLEMFWEQEGDNLILVGKILARNLNKKVGDEVDIEADVFTVAGIFESSNVIENAMIIMRFDQLQELMDLGGKVSFFEIQLDDRSLMPSVKEAIETAIPSVTALEGRQLGEDDIGLRLMRTMAWSISSIALFICVIGTMNTMFMSVFERTREIGILRALGWKSSRVLGMILGESICLSLLGGISGCILGVLLVKFIALSPQAEAYVYEKYSLEVFAKGMLLALCLGVGGGFYPAYRASTLSPLEAIRHE